MQRLDLKFVCHHGEFVKHRKAGREELAGRDVILVHRLLKNSVNERLGDHAYALFSDACIEAMGVDPAAQGLLEHRETIDVKVKCWVRDLKEAWQKENERLRHEVARDKALTVLECDIAAPRPTVWEYFIMPGQRPKWRGSDEVRETLAGGRRGVGTINHCIHGHDVFVEEVNDWRPFDYLTLTTLPPMPGAPKLVATYAFAETDGGGTHVEIRIGKPKPKEEAFFTEFGPVLLNILNGELAKLKVLLENRRGYPACGRGTGSARIDAALHDRAHPRAVTGCSSFRDVQRQTETMRYHDTASMKAAVFLAIPAAAR
jgi:uncharacterized protein YndB with AHSA1/START domain